MDREALRNDFYQSRSLPGRVSVAFKFINANFKYLFKRSSFILAPVALIQALFCVLATPVTFSVASIIATVLVSLLTIAGMLFFYSFIYTSLQHYLELGYLPAGGFKELCPPVLRNAKKLLYVGLFLFLIELLLVALMVSGMLISLYSLFVTVPLMLFLLVPFAYFGFRYLFGNEKIFVSFKQSYRLGITYWGSTFLMLLVILVLAGIIQLVAILPMYMGIFVESTAHLSMLQGNEVVLPGYFPFMLFLIAFISMFIYFMSMALVIILLAFQYGSVVADQRERKAESANMAEI